MPISTKTIKKDKKTFDCSKNILLEKAQISGNKEIY